MTGRHPLERLLRVIPDVADFTALRHALLGESEPDPDLRWASANRYVTYDKRVVDGPDVEAALAAARRAALARVNTLYDGATLLLDAAARNDGAAVVQGLIDLGAAAECTADWKQAAACYSLAASLGAPLPDRSGLVLALRRLARARLASGELEEARQLYQSSAAHADGDDIEARITAGTGMGNALSLQGRWAEAVQQYEAALALCRPADTRLRAQLHANQAMIARERGHLEEAARWLGMARSAWPELTDDDRSNWHNLAGLVALSSGDHDTAGREFSLALALASDDFTMAMVLDNVAELHLRRGRFEAAEAAARRAERHALQAGSPRALAEIYTRLGAICDARADANGVTFFEKAIEIAAHHGYPRLEALACSAYAAFRARVGDTEEALAYEGRARELTTRLGPPAT